MTDTPTPEPATLRRRDALVATAGLLGATLAGRGALAQNAYRDIFSTFAASPRFGYWTTLLLQSGLAAYARADTRITVFAPTNEAFYGNPGIYDQLVPQSSDAMPDNGRLIRFVRAHVVYGLQRIPMTAGAPIVLQSLAGSPITIQGAGSTATVSWRSLDGMIGTARLSQAPITCLNGLIYPLDQTSLR